MRAVIYARFSSDNQREESITAQVRACSEYAKQKGYHIVKIYADEARSALTDDRPNFLRMISDAKLGLFDIVLIHKLDRFARNRYDSAIYKRELRRCGVRIESVLEQLDDSPESIILESVLEGLAEYYSRNLAREVMKGMMENALQGKHNGGLPPLGYDVDPETKKLVVNESEARIVRLIFELYAQGKSYNDIISALNQYGFKTKKGKPFGKNSIFEILRNKKYIGIYIFNRSAPKKEGKRNHHLTKAPDEIIEIPGTIPTIIDEELFWRVQSIMDKRKRNRASNKAKTVYLLSGLIYCGECGNAMIGDSSSYLTKKSKEHKKLYYYTCNYNGRTGQCNSQKVRKELVEEFVLKQLRERFFAEKAIPELAEKIYSSFTSQKKEMGKEVKYIEKELKETGRKIANLVNALANGASTVNSIVEQLKLLESKKATLEVQLQEWYLKLQDNIVTKDNIIAFLKSKKEQLDSNDPVALKSLCQEFIDKVTVNNDKTDVEFKITVVIDGGGGGN
ncbi:recombinase family protein [Carboxydothermus pertinax]|uniref:Recombinase n=1 Tax=Carboxydothermus pertinax TaxID=870242 RepID=A0A1L8CRN8_9THEO|nr:recombinase family protein [Carboxydothermus pertinax]GAV21563.1 recombinase [Carboxydothermus pertinax]